MFPPLSDGNPLAESHAEKKQKTTEGKAYPHEQIFHKTNDFGEFH
jgi:hypothetical protein